MWKAVCFGVAVAVAMVTAVAWMWRESADAGECPSVKNAVENLRYQMVNDEVLNLTWDPPNTNDLIDKYIITVSQMPTSSSSNRFETTNTDYKFENLMPCSTYTFTVDVSVKKKNFSYKAQKLKVEMPDVAPLEPMDFRINFTSKIVEWTPGRKSETCARGWHLKFYHSHICIKDIVLSQDTTEYEVTDITSCLRYVATVQALGRKPSLNSAVVQREIGYDLSDFQKTSFVRNLNYSIEANDKIRLTWSNVDSQFAKCVYDYAVSVPTSFGFPLVSIRETHAMLSNLNSCGKYRVTVAARNIYKEFIGRPASIVVTTNALVPGPVTELHMISSKLNDQYLYWLPPHHNARCVEMYKVEQYSYASKIRMTVFTEDMNVKVNVKPCEQQHFKVSAVNSGQVEGQSSVIEYVYLEEENEIRSTSVHEEDGYLIVKWTFKKVISHCMQYYTLDICAMDIDVPCRTFKPNSQVLNDQMRVSIPDIIPCVTYKISISIMDDEKHYAYHSEIYQSQAKASAPPVVKGIDHITAHSATLKWKMRDQQKNRCSVLSSILECTTDGNSFMSYEFSAHQQPSDIATQVTNLSPYTNYSCYLLFNYGDRRSEKSTAIQFLTLEAAPSAVDALTVSRVTENSVTITWQPPKSINGVLKMYKLQVKRNRLLYELPSWCSYESKPFETVTLTEDVLNFKIADLNPFEEYAIELAAASGVGYGEPTQLTAVTAPAAPDPVFQPHYVSSSPFSYTVIWNQPCRSHGILKSFNVIVVGTRAQHPDDRFSYSITPNLSHANQTYSVKLPKLRPVYKYRVQISATVDKVNQSGVVSTLELTTPASLPPEPTFEHLVRKVNPRSVYGENGTKTAVTLTKDMFDDSGGDVLYYALIVGRDVTRNNVVESGSLTAALKWPEIGKWSEASTYDFVFQYQATPPYWYPFIGNEPNESVVYVIGEDAFCETAIDDYCNGPLKPETKYSMKIRAFTAAGYQDSPPLKFTTGSEIQNSQTNYWLAACVLLFLGFIVCGLFYVRTRYIPAFVEITQRMNGKRKLSVATTKSIPTKTFPVYYARLREASHIIKIEFNELNEVSAKYNLSDNIAKRYDNYRKNRYVNIVPYDENRVKINTENGDYINASFIEGYKNAKNRYIACQGPLATTFGDFWTMILQYDISIIVMLCQIVESKKTVCEKYFPEVNQTLTFDGINVECSIMTSNSLFEERRIIVSRGDKELVVSHIKFLEWPDFGIPSDPEILVDFCLAVRKRWTDKPIVVHCSAGVGRTGTFIACDILLQQLPNSKSVNIFNTVLQLRKQRPGMVQSVVQYTYLYECVYNGIKKLNETPASKLSCLM